MLCLSCDAHVPTAGVHSARVALLAEKAEVQYNPDQTSPEIIAEEINGLGFHADYLPDASSGHGHSITLLVHTLYPTCNIHVHV